MGAGSPHQGGFLWGKGGKDPLSRESRKGSFSTGKVGGPAEELPSSPSRGGREGLVETAIGMSAGYIALKESLIEHSRPVVLFLSGYYNVSL